MNRSEPLRFIWGGGPSGLTLGINERLVLASPEISIVKIWSVHCDLRVFHKPDEIFNNANIDIICFAT